MVVIEMLHVVRMSAKDTFCSRAISVVAAKSSSKVSCDTQTRSSGQDRGQTGGRRRTVGRQYGGGIGWG